MTLPRLYALIEYWRGAPPVAESVAAYLGIKADKPVKPMDAEKLQSFITDVRAMQKWPTIPPR